jgi:hypothetical protein
VAHGRRSAGAPGVPGGVSRALTPFRAAPARAAGRP